MLDFERGIDFAHLLCHPSKHPGFSGPNMCYFAWKWGNDLRYASIPLAAAILLECMTGPNRFALSLYHAPAFAEQVVSKLPRESFELSVSSVRDWLKGQKVEVSR